MLFESPSFVFLGQSLTRDQSCDAKASVDEFAGPKCPMTKAAQKIRDTAFYIGSQVRALRTVEKQRAALWSVFASTRELVSFGILLK